MSVYNEVYKAAFEDEIKKLAGVKEELRDPRLYSNLRGMATFESKKKRIKAYKNLGKGEGTVLSAMSTGFKRKKK